MIGTIEVVRRSTSFLCNEYRHREDIDFDQANKKDANEVTGGEHIMSTTKKGRLLEQVHPSQRQEMKTIWDVGGELGRLSVEYHMGHTLQVSIICSVYAYSSLLQLTEYSDGICGSNTAHKRHFNGGRLIARTCTIPSLNVNWTALYCKSSLGQNLGPRLL